MKRNLSAIGLLALLLWAPPSRGDDLRTVQVGQEIPPFALRTLSGKELDSADLRGKVVVLVYVAAQQQSSEKATKSAAVLGHEFRNQDLVIVYLTADVVRLDFFREQRRRLNVRSPFGLDVGREIYGALGLIVLPTTIVVDREGRLAHVISSYRSDYEHVLRASIRHTLGFIDDEEFQEELEVPSHRRDPSADRIARHRAAARMLRESGLLVDAANELRTALEIDPGHADTQLDLASLLIAQERFDEANQIVGRLLATDPDHRRAKLIYGIVLYHRGRLDEARQIFEEMLLRNPDPVQTHYYLGLISERQRDQSAAIEHFKEALERLWKKCPP